MPTVEERMGVVETKVVYLNDKVDDIKQDVKDTKQSIKDNHEIMMKKLDDMDQKYELNRDIFYQKLDKRKAEQDETDKALSRKISSLEQFKMKWVYIISGAAIVIGWVGAHGDNIIKLIMGK